MMDRRTILFTAHLCIGTLLGCGAPPPGDPSDIDPLREIKSTGTLEVRVDGNPRDVQYFINGVRIEPEEEIEWWNDALLRVELQPGFYEIEAHYRARGFARDKTVYRIETREPVAVRGGQVTWLLAKLEKDTLGYPKAVVTAFHEQSEPPRPAETGMAQELGSAAGAAGAAGMRADAASNRGAAPETDAAPTPDRIVIQGRAVGDDAVTRIEGAEGAVDSPDSGTGSIVIHGGGPSTETAHEAIAAPDVDPIDAASAQPTGHLPPLPAAVEEDLPPESSDSVRVFTPPASGDDVAGGPQISVLLRSEPTAALVTVDGRDAGTTPVRVRLDPSVDHVVQFELDGCDHVQLLPASAWERGRSSTVSVTLECR